MRTTNDLERITPLIWNELTTLGVPFIRCGVFIMDELEEQIHTFLSTPEGKAIAAFHLPYTSSPFFDAIEEWRAKKIHITRWDTEGFATLADSLVKEGQIATREQYLNTVPKDGLYLHYIPFLQGILYVGNTVQLTDDNLHLIQSVADAFSTAYARYEDFNKLEAAKQQVEKTLSDLKQAQQLLVQSEKMASLGELTAGIAHEIQNPLNFVNNFSEVSNELIEEIEEERSKNPESRNENLITEFLSDIKENLQKINHHGKRASDIVKGMLQHSRTSTGQKELADINALCDEYLLLAFHGFRAKDKSFNAKFETDFDSTLPKLHVIPQDIGRVILNLINNAFYAVNEKATLRQAQGDSYEPTVVVSTHYSLSRGEGGGEAIITIKDNGNGIPEKIKDKIFQPFFTTKPTGQGTGLGLSLSYDSVKAHGGELKVETKEGEGTTFFVLIPFR
ncbi:MAG: sensor histidine kinase [Cytophagales bacterium]